MKFLMGNINMSVGFSVFVAKKSYFTCCIIARSFGAHGCWASPAGGCGHSSDMERR